MLRDAAPDDAPALFEVHQRSVFALCAPDYPAAQIAAWFSGRSDGMYRRAIEAGQLWLAHSEGQVLGFVGAEPGEVTLLFVAPEAAGRGVGRRLFEFGLQRAGENFVGRLTVVATRNSVSFYARFGFAAVEEQAFIRGDPPLLYPVVRMMRESPAGAAPGGLDPR